MTVYDLISGALKLIGALAQGEVADANDANDALNALNDLVDSWNTERLTIYTLPNATYTPALLKQVYTLGPGGDFNQARPPRVDRITIISLQNALQPLELPMDDLTLEEWQAIPVKNVQSLLPLKYYNDNGFPLINVSVWPIPAQAIVQFRVYFWQALAAFSGLSQLAPLPPGYSRALRFNLAVDLAPEYGLPVDPQVARVAVESKAALMSLNIKPFKLQCDPELSAPGGYYNWRTDQPAGR